MSVWTSVTEAAEEFMSREEWFKYGGEHSGSVSIRCPWAKRYDVAADVLNNARQMPGSTGALASGVVIKGSGDGGPPADGELVYAEAVVTVAYEALGGGPGSHEEDEEGNLYSETIEQTIEHMTLDPSGFRWGTDGLGKPLREGPVRQLFGINFVRTLYEVAAIPAVLFDLLGTCNAAPYASATLGVTFPAETLAMKPATFQRSRTTAGAKRWTVVVKLGYKREGWNKFWNKDKPGDDKYDQIYSEESASIYKNFPTADYSELLY